MTWFNPVPFNLVETTNSNDFTMITDYSTSLPTGNHVGAFGTIRKHDIHTGVDLYVPKGTVVYAVEDGVVVSVSRFTGKLVGSGWWLDTDVVMVEGATGVVAYGEVLPCVGIGEKVLAGQPIAVVTPVILKNTTRPKTMLHLELYQHGTTDWVTHYLGTSRPHNLLDPTPHLRLLAAQTTNQQR